MAKIILHVEEGSTDCWKCPFHIVDPDGITHCGDHRLDLDCASFNLETLSFVKIEEE